MGFHVRYTHSLHKLNPKRFIIETSDKGTSSYLHIFDTIDSVAPSSKYIISDTYDVLTKIKYIVEAKVCTIPDVDNVKKMQKGRQRVVWGSKDTNNGRNRVRMLAEYDYGANPKKIAQRCI